MSLGACRGPQGWVAAVQDIPPTAQAPPLPTPSPAGTPVGPALEALGQALVGQSVMRFWPEDDFWWEAHVGDWNASKGHKLVYERGTPRESFEWARLGEFRNDELMTHPASSLPLAPALSPALSPAIASLLVRVRMCSLAKTVMPCRSACCMC